MTKWIRILVLSIIALDLVFLGHVFAHRNSTISVHEKIEHQINVPTKVAAPATPETEEQLIERQIVRSTIEVQSTMGHGTGTVVYQDKKIAYILTALHVVSHPGMDDLLSYTGVYTDYSNYIEEPLSLVNADRDSDLAIMSSKPVWVQAAKVVAKASDVRLYAKIFTYGFLGRVRHAGELTEGRISDFENLSVHGSPRMLTSCPVIYGNSGGGYWCNINGEFQLVGVACNVFIYQKSLKEELVICHVSLGASPTQILKFLKTTIADSK